MAENVSGVNPFIRAVNFASNVLGVVSAAGIVAATLTITYGVIVRYLFRMPTIWQTEISIYLLMGATFLGCPWVLKEEGHIHIDLVTSRFTDRVNAYLNVFTSIVAMVFCVLVAWRAWIMWYEAFEGGWESESILSVPLVYPYLILPLGMSLTFLQFIVRIVGQVKKLGGRE
jgi:TRAP-type C4-dicarboxylate transport system permease small subunit